MKILITGASGLLGLNLAFQASAEGHTVYGVVNSQPVNTQAFTVITSDLLAPGAVERLLEWTQPDWIIHCAALANLDACESDPEQASKLNTELPRRLAQRVSKGGARLVHISTDSVFDGSRGYYREEDAPNPLGIYSASKLAGELAVAEADPTAIIARVVLYGWSPSGRRSLAEFFYNNLIQGKQVMGFTDVHFCPLLANHLAHLLMAMLEKELHGLYHVVSSQHLSKYEFGLRIARRFGLDEELVIPTSIHQAGLRATRSTNLILRTDKLTRDLGTPPPGIDSGIDRFYSQLSDGYANMIKEAVWNST